MSSCDHGRPGPSRGRAILFALAAALSLSACVVQPLYGPAAGGGKVATTLAKITIDPVDDRVAQVVRNKLIFGLTGGRGMSDPVYRMKLTTTVTQAALGITTVEAAPAYSVTVAVTYQLSKIDDATAPPLSATVRGTASYNRVNQIFANTRAKIDAENRAAEAAADQIQVRVATAVATGA
jgi:LPS-assembly lipoprotein